MAVSAGPQFSRAPGVEEALAFLLANVDGCPIDTLAEAVRLLPDEEGEAGSAQLAARVLARLDTADQVAELVGEFQPWGDAAPPGWIRSSPQLMAQLGTPTPTPSQITRAS